jgi:hypothetical protein
MEAWVLMIGVGWGGLTAVPNISTHQECERLAVAMQLSDYKCVSYQAAK